MDITAYNNERFVVSFDVTAFVPFYTLDTAAWRMQVRKTAESNNIEFDIPNIGQAEFIDGTTAVITFLAPIAAVKNMAGSYVWDFGFTPVGGEFTRCDGGTFTMNVGVTR